MKGSAGGRANDSYQPAARLKKARGLQRSPLASKHSAALGHTCASSTKNVAYQSLAARTALQLIMHVCQSALQHQWLLDLGSPVLNMQETLWPGMRSLDSGPPVPAGPRRRLPGAPRPSSPRSSPAALLQCLLHHIRQVGQAVRVGEGVRVDHWRGGAAVLRRAGAAAAPRRARAAAAGGGPRKVEAALLVVLLRHEGSRQRGKAVHL